MLLNVFKLLLNFNQVYSDLSLKDVQKTVDEVFVNDKTADLTQLKETIANPAFGFFADKSGLIYNIRFFSPYIKATYENRKTRKYIDDESDDPITSLIIRLYPSPAGQLTTSTAHISNPLKLFENNKKESVKFFARLFTAVLNDRIGPFKFKFHWARGEDQIEFNKRCEIFNKLKQLFFDKKADSIFKDKTIKLLLIHSYIINVLDPFVQGEGEDYFKFYLTEIANSYKFYLKELGKSSRFPKKNKFLEKKIEKEVLQIAFDYYESLNSFPYSVLNKPESNKSIPSYIRSKDIFSENEDEKYSDCADIALLHLCNCLFFYKGKYRIDHLPKASFHLNSFYKKYDKIYTLTMEIRKEWSKVIQDLNEENDDNSIYPTKNVLYCSKINNEINPGIINMMNILIRITGLTDEKILEDINAENLEEKLKFLIDRLSIKENEESVACINIDSLTIKEHETNINNKKDFSGFFTIDFQYDDKTGGIIKFNHEKNLIHAELTFEEDVNSKFDFNNKSEILKKLEASNYENLLFSSFLFSEDINLAKNFDEYLNKIYFSGRIDTNDLSLKILQMICEFIDQFDEPKTEKNQEKLNKLENLMSLILDRIELFDYSTKFLFKKFLFFKISALDKDDSNLAISGYIKSLETESNFLIKKWEETFSKTHLDFEDLNIGFCVYNLGKNEFFQNKTKNILIDNIHNFVNIKKLELSNLHLNEKEFKGVLDKLTNPEKLEKLDLTCNYGLKIEKSIEKLSALKSLNLSNCKIKIIPDSFCLNSLEELDLSGNNIRNCSSKIFKNFPNLKKIDLKHTLLSAEYLEKIFKFINPEELDISCNLISTLPKKIKNLTKLKVLNIENTKITDLPEELNELKFLENIFLDKANFSDETLEIYNKKIVSYILLEYIC